MQIAVVGGGIFGTTTAVRLARAGHAVELFEKAEDIITAASAINQYRLHRGYHYPRSSETVRSIIDAEVLFKAEYGDAVIEDPTPHVYGIAARDSLTSADEYLRFCDAHGLSYALVDAHPSVMHGELDLVLEAQESRYDPVILKALVQAQLKTAGVAVHLATTPTARDLSGFEQIVVATYAGLNAVDLPEPVPELDLQFEVCEKPVVRMPAHFSQHGIVIMDGPFMCIDPYGNSGLFVLGNVVHAIHASNTGAWPIIPPALAPFLNRGIIANPPITHWPAFVESGARFIPDLRDAEHVGSLFTVRTVLPRLEATDARPTIVERVSARCIRVFSGKVANCVQAADAVLALLHPSSSAPNAAVTRS